ncbi:MAG: Asp-tRNA(Asn)/Glu-tRNA(Gln) amidotransferase subunit GatB [Saprospiraceae bacterium]
MKWETIIGLEIHIQLNTLTKAFCSDEAKFSNDPNTQTSIISLAHPGTLPKLNTQQIESAVRLGLAMDCEINQSSYFERKQYFYPDLPKGYQISQQASPICLRGHLDILTSTGNKKIRLHHIHMEEDAGKSVHDTDPYWSKIDLNRAGVPLLEMVTEPDFRNAEEVSVFLSELQRMVRYLDISDANMEEGSMRCDVNVSVRPEGTQELRERCEVKNVNSKRFARKAIEFEVQRQIQLWESGQTVRRQTMQFIPEEGITTPIRQKEDAHDYRYFPDPDLPPVLITAQRLADIKTNQPLLPSDYLDRLLKEKNLQNQDAFILLEEKSTVEYYLKLVDDQPALNKTAANWVIQSILPYIQEHHLSIDQFPISGQSISTLLNSIIGGKLTVQQGQEIWSQALVNSQLSMEDLIKSKLLSVPTLNVNHIIEEVFTSNPEEAKEFRNGKKKLLGFFLGEIKRKYPGINIKEVQEILSTSTN